MYQGTKATFTRKDCQALRFANVKNHPGLIIDQYGRVFENTKKMKYVGSGYATH